MKKQTMILYLCTTLIACMFLTNCAQQRVWRYSADPYSRGAPLMDKTVVVLPLQDGRENMNTNMLAMSAIPLFPYGWANYHTPEGVEKHVTSTIWFFDPDEDLAKAIAEELNNSRIFKEVFFSYKATEGDLVLRGEIKSTFFNGKVYSYGLSSFGSLLWFIGLPAASASNELYITLTLEDPETGQVLWTEDSRRGKSETSWIYSFKPDFYYDKLLKGAMKQEFIPSLKETFRRVAAE